MFSEETIQAIGQVAGQTGIETAALLAVAEMESGGRSFARVDGRKEPPIRFEGHYFDRRLSPENRAAARSAGLSSPEAGGVKNPKTQAGRWRLLERAAAIDRKAAYESVSWGLGQVMGAHWAWLDYADVEALAAEARSGALGQARLMARYIDRAGLAPALRARDWRVFARGYNGPAYRRNGYHLKIEAAYARHSRGVAARAEPLAAHVLRPGARGEAVRELQLSLTALGYPAEADGIFGPATAAALRRFQTEHGLTPDGLCGQETQARLGEALARRGPAMWTRLRGIVAGWPSRMARMLDRTSRLW